MNRFLRPLLLSLALLAGAAAAGPVADLVERWRARGIDLAVDAGTGRQDLDLQAETFALAEAIWPATGGTS